MPVPVRAISFAAAHTRSQRCPVQDTPPRSLPCRAPAQGPVLRFHRGGGLVPRRSHLARQA